MTTVLARPLGGYGLTPLIFEPSSISLIGQSSNSIETKVRKSPVFEMLTPNYDDEHISPLPLTGLTGGLILPKKLDYESLITKKDQDKTLSSPSTNSYFSDNNVLELFNKDKQSQNLYDEVIPSYKEQIARSDIGKSSRSISSNYMPYSSSGPVSAAVQSVRSVEVKDVQNSYQNNEPQIIDIPPSALPIVINFRTSSSQIQIHQSHEHAEPAEVQQTQSEDDPTYLKHQVTKPVIQEVHEIILPYRKIIQEIRPVEEEIKTVVARAGKDRTRNTGGLKYGNNAEQKKSLAGNDLKYKS